MQGMSESEVPSLVSIQGYLNLKHGAAAKDLMVSVEKVKSCENGKIGYIIKIVGDESKMLDPPDVTCSLVPPSVSIRVERINEQDSNCGCN